MEKRLRLVQGTNIDRFENRLTERRPVSVPGQIVWKDGKGTTRMASVVTRDVSELGVSVECLQGARDSALPDRVFPDRQVGAQPRGPAGSVARLERAFGGVPRG